VKFLPSLLLLFCLSVPLASQEAPLRETVALDAKEWPADWRMHVEFSTSLGGRLEWPSGFSLELLGKNHDVAMEFPENKPPVLRVWTDGKLAKGPEEVAGLAQSVARDYPEANLDWGTDFTAYARFTTKDGGTLLAKCAPEGKWSADAKALYIKEGKLIYDIGWLGALGGGSKVDDGKEHTVVLTVDGGKATLWLDGKEVGSKEDFSKPDVKGHVMKIGRASPDFGGDFKGDLGDVRFWKRAMDQKEVATLFQEGVKGANTPDFQVQPLAGGRPVVKAAEGGNVVTGWVQALERTDHSELVASWNADSLAEGKVIYEQLCMVCHGTLDKPGSLPTALRFSEGVYKNGSDPYAQYLTLTKGFGQMVPQPQYTTKQKYAVIQYIRETFLKEKNPGQYVEVTPGYLQRLPKGKTLAEEEKVDRTPPPYEQMEMGPALFWTLQIEKNNVARKGIAIRLDEGPGGVTKGKAWMIYDHDTMRLAAATTGGFVDWKGIAFDGSHGTHTSLSGERHVVLPPGPGWASPDNSWDEVARKGAMISPLVLCPPIGCNTRGCTFMVARP
jgi:mono/diheme cytochrome c family protein